MSKKKIRTVYSTYGCIMSFTTAAVIQIKVGAALLLRKSYRL